MAALQQFEAYDEAEARVGFPILRPNDAYPLAHGKVYVRSLRGRLTTSAQYTIPDIAPSSVTVDTGPSESWEEGALTRGSEVQVGDKRGWLIRDDDTAMVFAFSYAGLNGESLWCLVTAPARMGRAAFGEFVGGLASG